MEDTLFQKADLLWEQGQHVATNIESRNSLYVYENQFFVIWYDGKNELEKVERVSEEKAVQLFNPREWRLA